MRDEFLWVEKYRPQTIEDCILPENTKKTFLEFLNKGEVPNLLLSGPAGCGKEIAARYIHANSSRASSPFMSVSCATIESKKMEEVLFGSE